MHLQRKKFYSTTELARERGIAPQKIRKAIANGALHATMIRHGADKFMYIIAIEDARAWDGRTIP